MAGIGPVDAAIVVTAVDWTFVSSCISKKATMAGIGPVDVAILMTVVDCGASRLCHMSKWQHSPGSGPRALPSPRVECGVGSEVERSAWRVE